jgi:hypothetical protein
MGTQSRRNSCECENVIVQALSGGKKEKEKTLSFLKT